MAPALLPTSPPAGGPHHLCHPDRLAHDEHSYDTPLAARICAGGRAIISDYRIHSDGAAAILACSGTAFLSETNFGEMDSDSALFAGSIAPQPGLGYFSVALDDEKRRPTAHTDGSAVPKAASHPTPWGTLPNPWDWMAPRPSGC